MLVMSGRNVGLSGTETLVQRFVQLVELIRIRRMPDRTGLELRLAMLREGNFLRRTKDAVLKDSSNRCHWS
jgi:hypothetical protein